MNNVLWSVSRTYFMKCGRVFKLEQKPVLIFNTHTEIILFKLIIMKRSSSYSATTLLVWPWLPHIIDTHFSLSNAFFLHHFTPSFLKSSSTSFIYLSLGRPLSLLPSNFPSKIFFTDMVSFILITCPSHSNLYYSHNILGFIFGYQFCVNFNSPLSILLCWSIYFSSISSCPMSLIFFQF